MLHCGVLYVLFSNNLISARLRVCFQTAGQRVIGEPILSGLALDDSWLWHPDFETAAKQVPSLVSLFFHSC
jgi:hypothetical protein